MTENTPDPRELSTSLLVIRTVKDRVAAADTVLREQTAESFVVGDKVTGLVGGEPIGYVQRTAGRQTWQVVDADALRAWCDDHAPGEVETVTTTRVRPAFVAAALARCKADGGLIDSASGEFTPAEDLGLQVTVGPPGVTVKPNPDADRIVAEALASGALQLPSGVQS